MADAVAAGGEQLKALARRLRAAGSEGKGLRRGMRKAVTTAVKPMQTAVKGAIEAIPTHGDKHTGLRAAMSKATKIRIRASGSTALVRLEVDPGSMPAGKQKLPALMDGRAGQWRHPYYGHRSSWFDQDSHPYFDRAVDPRIPGVRAAVRAAVKATADSITI